MTIPVHIFDDVGSTESFEDREGFTHLLVAEASCNQYSKVSVGENALPVQVAHDSIPFPRGVDI